jgi:hypothetical protein
MDSAVHRWQRSLAVFGALMGLMATVVVWGTPAGASNQNPGVLPPSSTAFGRAYGGWSAAWWQYVEAQPVSTNPLVDLTGAGCRVGQSGPVFFLVGANGTGTVTRDECTVPAGKALFFPLLNAFDVHVSCDLAPATVCDTNDTPAKIWNDLQNNLGFSASSLQATIDGVPVQNLDPANTPYRACAGPVARCNAAPFSLTFPADNFFAAFGLPAGTYAPAVADGFYLLVAPLTVGHHTVTFGGTGTFAGGAAVQDITYNLVVSSQ